MQRFHWNLHSSQEIKVKDSHVEREGDKLVNVTETEHYVKLAFTRDLDTPNIDKLRQIETEYNNRSFPSPPSLGWPIGLTGVFGFGVLFDGGISQRLVFLSLAAACGYWVYMSLEKRKLANATCQQSAERGLQLLQQADSLA